MKMRIQVIIESELHDTPVTEEVACIEREDLTPETLGMTLAEAKDLLAHVQASMAQEQTSEYIEQQRPCPHCGKVRSDKGQHRIVFRSLFGKLSLLSPRLYTCSCQPQEQQSLSPLVQCLPERTAPEWLYLQAKWASLMSYGLTVDHLEEVLPLQANVATVFRNTQAVAERIESELGDEQHVFIEGCPGDWERLPFPDEPLTVGIDGGYVHAREGTNRKAGYFEVIAGRIITAEDVNKCFSSVHGYDRKPRRRLFQMLEAQGLQMNQTITFLSDGGDTVRDLQLYLSPSAEHLLDWFHITMRITVMKQMAKGLPDVRPLQDIALNLERVKWSLWHSNVFKALQVLDDMQIDLETIDEESTAVDKLEKTVNEFTTYIERNRTFIPNYADRYRYGELISTAFAESTVNQVVSKRMVQSTGAKR